MSEARAPLRRSSSDRVLGGVCGGLGEFFGLKPLWFRIVFVILGIPGGLPGLVPYVLLWLIIPEEGAE
jgi:phage shock protein C